jgi:predicted chitinase
MDKYGIKSKEQVCSFLAQCSHETGRGQWVTENGDDAYFATKSYSKTFRGGGYMHMTFDYAYQAYATHRLLEDHPELQEFGKYRNPANNNAASIANEYNKLIDAAKNAGIDVSDYTNIATQGADYVGANHAWDCAAYYWKTSGCNDCIAKGGTNSDVNEIVNKWDTDSFALRNQYYNTLYDNYDKIFG